MQGSIIPTGGTAFSQILLMATMLMGLYYTVKTLSLKNKPVYFCGLNVFFALLTVYGIVLLFSDQTLVVKAKLFNNEVSKYNYLKYLFLSFPNVYTFYYFSRKGFLTETLLKKWVFAFCGVAIFKYIDYQMSFLQAMAFLGSDAEETTNNVGYVFVSLIPALVVFRNNAKWQYGILILCLAFIVMGMKRGAILIGAISLIYFLYYNYKYNRSITKGKIIFFSLLIVAFSLFIVNYMMESSDYFMSRIEATEEGRTSGRDEIYEFFWTHFKNEADTLKFLFGNGANATLQIGINYAHNDWLELAINQGVVGLVAYMFYWICFFRTIKSAKYNKEAAFVLSLSFIALFMKTMFSMSYTDYSYMLCTVFGYYLAHLQKRKINGIRGRVRGGEPTILNQ